MGTVRSHPSLCFTRRAHSLTEQRQGPFQAYKHPAAATSAAQFRAFARPHHNGHHIGALHDWAQEICILQRRLLGVDLV